MSRVQYLGETTQRSGESIAYPDDVTAVGSTPTVNSVHIFNTTDLATNTDGTNLSGSASVSGNVITTPLVTALTDGQSYRVVINYTISSNIFEDYFTVHCSDDD